MIGIVDRPSSFSDRWIEVCQQRKLAYTLIDPYSNDLIEQLKPLSAFLWNWAHFSPADMMLAPHLSYCCEKLKIPCFPSINTVWTFDDKVAQKYVLESSGLPFVKSYVFYDREQAMQWARSTSYPKVFKLKCGAGSRNVKLVPNQGRAIDLIKTAFDKGFVASGGNVSDAVGKIREGKLGVGEFIQKLMRMPRTLNNIRRLNRLSPRQAGYAYFQEFVPGNTHDTRVTVVGDRAFAFRRAVRSGDFRASGSGQIDYDREQIDRNCIQTAFQLADYLDSQSLCVDFVHGPEMTGLIVEISYTYLPSAVYAAGGTWNRELEFVPGATYAEDLILDNLLQD